ncbi:protein K [Serratia marcescens]|nr:protein K [Serratia marcescens]ELQ9442302.1 protein K [Serratia marcescens]ELT5563062.1 protein K [Serratia marcescens]
MVKYLALTTLILTVFFTSGCDNSSKLEEITSQSTEEKIQQFNELKDNDTSAFQKVIVSETKKQLPLLVDENTLMVDVSTDGNAISYKYVIKGIPESVINDQFWQEAMQRNVKNNYCLSDSKVKLFRGLFPNGVIYNYYRNDSLVYKFKMLESMCD